MKIYDVQSEMAKLTREFDGSEVKDVQLQQQINLMLQTDQKAEASGPSPKAGQSTTASAKSNAPQIQKTHPQPLA